MHKRGEVEGEPPKKEMPIRRRPERARTPESEHEPEPEKSGFTMQRALAEARTRGGEVPDAIEAMLAEAIRDAQKAAERVDVLRSLSAELTGAELAADWESP